MMYTLKEINNRSTGKYPTLKEAKRGVLKLKPMPRTREEYWERYKQDERLPRIPSQVYMDEWEGWHDFLWHFDAKVHPIPKEAESLGNHYYLYQDRMWSYHKGYFKQLKYRLHPTGQYMATWVDKDGKSQTHYVRV